MESHQIHPERGEIDDLSWRSPEPLVSARG